MCKNKHKNKTWKKSASWPLRLGPPQKTTQNAKYRRKSVKSDSKSKEKTTQKLASKFWLPSFLDCFPGMTYIGLRGS